MKKLFIIVLSICILVLTGCAEQFCEHSYSKATCTSPSTCSKCGVTQGSKLGHTTNLGKCERCSQKITTYLDEAKNIINTYQDAVDNFTDGANEFLTFYYADAAFACEVMDIYLEAGYKNALEAVSLCGDYPEFAELKQVAQYLADVYAGVRNYGSITDFIGKQNSAISAIQKANDRMLEITETWN